jgi:hypothetical protein
MTARIWLMVALVILAGLMVMFAKPTGRKQRSAVPWRGQVKPPAPPPIPRGPVE